MDLRPVFVEPTMRGNQNQLCSGPVAFVVTGGVPLERMVAFIQREDRHFRTIVRCAGCPSGHRCRFEPTQRRRPPPEPLDFEEAAHFYERAVDVRRDQPEVLWDLAMILLTDNRTEGAMAVLRELLEVAPRHSDARLTLGVLCERETNCSAEESRAHLEAFLILAPNDPNAELAKQNLEHLQ